MPPVWDGIGYHATRGHLHLAQEWLYVEASDRIPETTAVAWDLQVDWDSLEDERPLEHGDGVQIYVY